DTSQLYGTNLFNLVSLLWDKAEKQLAIDWEDEIVKGTLVTRDGEIVHPNLEQVKADLAAAPATAAAPKAPARKAPARKAPTRKPAASKPAAESTDGGAAESQDDAATAKEAEKNGK